MLFMEWGASEFSSSSSSQCRLVDPLLPLSVSKCQTGQCQLSGLAAVQ